ncbi:MAG: carboxymethylenebutenolidase [Solirubrobacteraceae bacterium]|nr:carboxymethylenebutenolidase [Solirubrobacteraceae bacterium]
MCFDLDSTPPVPAIAGAAVAHEVLVLESADGTRFAAFAALPDAPNGIGVAILPDVRGLYRFYEELALRFAERGYAAIAIDYFGRTAGAGKRDEDFDYMPHVKQATPAGVQADAAAAVAELRARGARSVFTVGFCFGGRHSWLATAEPMGLSGGVGFYGMPGERDGVPGPTQRAGELRAPILALMGGEDHAIGPDQVQAFDAALEEAGVEHEVVTYDGAPHSFFDRKQEEFAEASEDAWRRTLEFLEAHAR